MSTFRNTIMANTLRNMVLFLVGVVLAAVLAPVAYEFLADLEADANVPSWVTAIFLAFVGIGFLIMLVELVMPGTVVTSRRR